MVVIWFLALVCAFALALAHLTEGAPSLYIMSLAPAGVIEMSLVAISLGTNPVFVTAHHVARISLTVLISPLLFRFLRRSGRT